MTDPEILKTSLRVSMRARAAVLSMLVALSSCSPGGSTMLQTLQQIARRGGSGASASLNPNYRYLRVTIASRVVFLALGNEDVDPRGSVEVWYSAEREVMRLQGGRIVGAVGLTTEWRSVSLPELPSWSALARSDHVFRWTRTRDLMPGYRFGVKDALLLRILKEPQSGALQDLDPQRLTWFEERFEAEPVAGVSTVLGRSIAPDTALPPARYAVDFRDGLETVVYGEQCLAPDLCFTWQRWPVHVQNANEKK